MAQRVSPAGFPVGADDYGRRNCFRRVLPHGCVQLGSERVSGRIHPQRLDRHGPAYPTWNRRIDRRRRTALRSVFEGYPEIAYDSRRNRYLVITWHTSSPWVIHGVLTDGNATPLTGTLTLASLSGGDGIGLAYSPVTDSYLGVFQSQLNDEVWGAEINVHGGPSSPFQITASGTRLAPQPMPAADLLRPRWLTVAPNGLANVMGQFVGVGAIPTAIGSAGGGGPTPPPPTGCPSIQPAPELGVRRGQLAATHLWRKWQSELPVHPARL